VATLEQAWKAALDEGLHFVYIGNVPGHEAEHTTCPKCKARVIERTGYKVQTVRLQDGKCLKCGHAIPGVWTV
jgi:pyruvate formate lyase activating enzyme